MPRGSRKVPRGTFWLGGLVGVALGVPLVSLALPLLGRSIGAGEPAALERVLRLAAWFAAAPAFVAGGGAARLCSHRAAERPEYRTLPAMMGVAAAAMGAAGVGLAFLVAVPLGGMPERPGAWTPIAAAGFGAGALTGLAIGALCGARRRRHASPEGVEAS